MTDATDGPDIVVSAKPTKRPPNELTLIVAGNEMSGWEEIEVALRAEGFPNSFNILMSSKEPITSKAVVAKAGDSCTVLLGDDTVITGYIDRDIPGATPTGHAIRLVGRGKTQDLVDCAAEWTSSELVMGTALDIAKNLALPYSIGVMLGDGAAEGPQVPPLCLNYGETAADIIQRAARNAGLLAYENEHGQLVLATLGTKTAASAIVYGENVQAFEVTNSMDQRYSEIVCCAQSMAAWGDLPGSDFFDTETDPNVPRHRRMCIVLEQVADQPQDFTIKKAKWEIARRAGRSAVVTATVDSWRDSGGNLWLPNTLAPVDVPGLRETDKTLCIAQATFRRSSETGTTADLVLMPKYAFKPEPISLLPLNEAEVPVGPGQ